MILLKLFYEFFKTGLFAVGGGLATLPFLYNMAETTNWFTAETVMDMIAISESTPGPIGVNMATYAGFTTAGVLGSLCATIGLVFPSVVVIIWVYKIMEKFKGSQLVQSVFYGLRPAVAGLIAAAGLQALYPCLIRFSGSFDPLSLVGDIQWLAIILFVALYFLIKKFNKLHPLVFIAASAVVGVLFQFGA
ncbi:MAG: chromate transporter [Oscillospiraceae bacterium]|nr:chromate transporter [Oscillospiraceae bacterium]